MFIEPEKSDELIDKDALNLSDIFGKTYLDVDIIYLLKLLGESLSADRTYFYLLRYNEGKNSSFYRAYKWCANELDDFSDLFKEINKSDIPWFMNKFKKKGAINIDNPDSIPREAEIEFMFFAKERVKSALLVPIISESERIIGFIGAEKLQKKQRWKKEHIKLLKKVSELYYDHVMKNKFELETKSAMRIMKKD